MKKWKHLQVMLLIISLCCLIEDVSFCLDYDHNPFIFQLFPGLRWERKTLPSLLRASPGSLLSNAYKDPSVNSRLPFRTSSRDLSWSCRTWLMIVNERKKPRMKRGDRGRALQKSTIYSTFLPHFTSSVTLSRSKRNWRKIYCLPSEKYGW